MLGYTPEELVNKSIWDFTHQDDLAVNKQLYDQLMRDRLPFRLEKRLIRKDGSILWVNVSVSPVMDVQNRLLSAVAVEVDITARKQIEQELHQLNSQLESQVEQRTLELKAANQALQKNRRQMVEIQEEERRAIARELHDRVGQMLTALNLNLTIIQGQLSNDALERVGARLADSIHLLNETIPAVRDVMSNLRPVAMDEYGLEAALKLHVEEFTSRHDVLVAFWKPDPPLPLLTPTIEMTIFRIIQEALFNVAKHAQASNVKLSVTYDERTICITVEDDGIGFKVRTGTGHLNNHGLNIMRERAEAVGGEFSISSQPGDGTKLQITVPHQSAQRILESRE
jgi:PAS domain S-box-containing protein